MPTDHAAPVKVIESRSFDLKSDETGERVRIIVELVDEGTHRSMSHFTLVDLVAEALDDLINDTDNLDLLEIKHPYEGR